MTKFGAALTFHSDILTSTFRYWNGRRFSPIDDHIQQLQAGVRTNSCLTGLTQILGVGGIFFWSKNAVQVISKQKVAA